MDESHSPSRLQQALDQLASSGFTACGPDASPSEMLAEALARCIASLDRKFDAVSTETLPHQAILTQIEEALRSMECPYTLEFSEIGNLDSEILLPVVQWLLDRVRASFLGRGDEDQRKVVALNQLQILRERVRYEGAETKMKMLVSLMQSLKELDRQESEFRSYSANKLSQLEDEVIELEKSASGGCSESISEGLNQLLSESKKELDAAKKELAATLRALILVKRQLDDVP